MSVVAIIGAGPIGASFAQTLARRARVRHVRLIGVASQGSAGKGPGIRPYRRLLGVGLVVAGDRPGLPELGRGHPRPAGVARGQRAPGVVGGRRVAGGLAHAGVAHALNCLKPYAAA